MNKCKHFILLIFTIISFSTYSQNPISKNYTDILNGKIKSNDEFILKVTQCLKKPLYEPICPFCDCYSIDSLVTILKSVPKYKIQIISHTDFRGSEKNNLILSKNISKSVRDYLVKASIDSSRIISIGLGEKQPYCFKNDTIIDNINIKKGTIINEKLIASIKNKELKEQFMLLNRRILIKFTF